MDQLLIAGVGVQRSKSEMLQIRKVRKPDTKRLCSAFHLMHRAVSARAALERALAIIPHFDATHPGAVSATLDSLQREGANEPTGIRVQPHHAVDVSRSRQRRLYWPALSEGF